MFVSTSDLQVDFPVGKGKHKSTDSGAADSSALARIA